MGALESFWISRSVDNESFSKFYRTLTPWTIETIFVVFGPPIERIPVRWPWPQPPLPLLCSDGSELETKKDVLQETTPTISGQRVETQAQDADPLLAPPQEGVFLFVSSDGRQMASTSTPPSRST